MKGVQNSYGFSSEFISSFSDYPQYFDASASTESGIWPANTMVESPASALYTNEIYMGLCQDDNQGGSCFLGDSSSQTQTNDPLIMLDGSFGNPIVSLPEHVQSLLVDIDNSNRRSPCLPFDANNDLGVSQNLSAPQLANISQFGPHPGCFATRSGNNFGSPSAVSSAKTRIRWTRDLHDRFVDCVNQLGGPGKATPKAILTLMDTEGLTVKHVKSHLQKYRNVKNVSDSVEGRSEKNSTNNVDQINAENGMQFKVALQLQLDVQMRLHEQLEIQRNLQLMIEEQAEQLKRMVEQQQKAAQNPITLSPKVEYPQVLDSDGSDDNGFPIKID